MGGLDEKPPYLRSASKTPSPPRLTESGPRLEAQSLPADKLGVEAGVVHVEVRRK